MSRSAARVGSRPDDTYQRLLALEWEGAQAEQIHPDGLAVGSEANLLASATVWRTVLKHRCAVAIDVNAGTFQLLGQAQLRHCSFLRQPNRTSRWNVGPKEGIA